MSRAKTEGDFMFCTFQSGSFIRKYINDEERTLLLKSQLRQKNMSEV
jgi:hypothetical protein